MAELHPLLQRQLTKVKATPDDLPSHESWQALLARISQAYVETDQDRYLSERALKISNLEMRAEIDERMKAEFALQSAHDNLEQQVAARTVDLMQINLDLRDQIARREEAEKQLA